MTRLSLFARRTRRYLNGENRCGYCGLRAWRYRSASYHGCYRWITCDRCRILDLEPYFAEFPPYFAYQRKPRCGDCTERCGIDARPRCGKTFRDLDPDRHPKGSA